MKLTKFFVSLAAIAIVTEVTRRIVTDNNAQSSWDAWLDDWDDQEDDEMFFYNSDEDDFMAYYGFKHPKALETPAQKAERKQARKALLAEQDYWLAQLSDALSTQNEADKAEANENLQRIVDELGAL